MKSKNAFTVIELIVVVAIIAVLASIVSVSVMQYVQKSKNASALANLKSLGTGAAKYIDSTGDIGGYCLTVKASADAIYKLGFIFYCYDSTASSSEIDFMAPGQFQTLSGNCSQGRWAAKAGSSTSSAKFCVDYTGFSGSGDINISACNCAP